MVSEAEAILALFIACHSVIMACDHVTNTVEEAITDSDTSS